MKADFLHADHNTSSLTMESNGEINVNLYSLLQLCLQKTLQVAGKDSSPPAMPMPCGHA